MKGFYRYMKKVVFWIIQLTWGLLMNFIGAMAFIVLILLKHKPKVFRDMVYFEVGGSCWGGFNLGFVAIVNSNPSEFLLKHEYGHFMQNAMFGILCPFLVDIPSAVRYHYREYIYKKDKLKYFILPDYYSIWFEKQANKLGERGI